MEHQQKTQTQICVHWPRMVGLLVAVFALVIDQASKQWLLYGLGLITGRVIELSSFFNLVMVWNFGVSFGLFAGDSDMGPWVLSGLALMVCVILAVWLYRANSYYLSVALGLVIGGAIGNVIDRIRFGAVADFFDLFVLDWHWPAFNIADSCIVVGVAMLLLEGIVCRRDHREITHDTTDKMEQ